MIIGKVHRFIPALIGTAFTIIIVLLITLQSPGAVLNVLNFESLGQIRFWIQGQERVESHGVNWQTIAFIGGMMTMLEGLDAVGFFHWLCLHVAKMINYKVIPILIAFMLLPGFLAMFIDSITVVFLATVTIELAFRKMLAPQVI